MLRPISAQSQPKNGIALLSCRGVLQRVPVRAKRGTPMSPGGDAEEFSPGRSPGYATKGSESRRDARALLFSARPPMTAHNVLSPVAQLRTTDLRLVPSPITIHRHAIGESGKNFIETGKTWTRQGTMLRLGQSKLRSLICTSKEKQCKSANSEKAIWKYRLSA
jgi:hypothetical protein